MSTPRQEMPFTDLHPWPVTSLVRAGSQRPCPLCCSWEPHRRRRAAGALLPAPACWCPLASAPSGKQARGIPSSARDARLMIYFIMQQPRRPSRPRAPATPPPTGAALEEPAAAAQALAPCDLQAPEASSVLALEERDGSEDGMRGSRPEGLASARCLCCTSCPPCTLQAQGR